MFSLPVVSREAARPRLSARRLSVEPLENRELFSISPNNSDDAVEGLLSHGGGCSCPICTGTIAFSPEMRATASAADSAKNALSALPQLNSLPGSQFTLFLDFDGGYTTGWESTAVYTPVYDFDGDFSTFSTAELNSIRDIWTRVAEDYSPFNINVTTVDPGNLTNGRTAKIAIGGNYDDWFGSSAGGVAYVGGFYNSASNVGFVFSDALANGVARYVAEATSHEAGHLFGLWHQSTYNGSGTKTAEYSTGNSQWAPIMGVGYYSAVTTWYNGPNNLGANSLQDDMSIISGASNTFGYRADEAGDNTASTTSLSLNGNTVSGSGIVGRNTDQDFYRFSTSGGAVNISASTASVGANLDVVLEIRRADGSLVTSAAPTTSLSATITANLSAGDYFLVVRSTGVYGFVGQYTLAGTVPAGAPGGNGGGSSGDSGSGDSGDTGGDTSNNNSGSNNNNTPSSPEITVLENGTAIADNTSTVSYGTVRKGTTVSKTFTVRNDGTANLILTQIKEKNLPKGFKLVRGFTDTNLSAGESTTFIVSMKNSKGSYGGTVSFNNNDADENPFNFRIAGVVNKTGVASAELPGRSETFVAMGVSLTEQNLTQIAPAEVARIDVAVADDLLDLAENNQSNPAITPEALAATLESSFCEAELQVGDELATQTFAEATSAVDGIFHDLDEALSSLLTA